ncbi:MAG: hypothetical protein KC964_13610 [Candidatus Omnitrophica bacterium]|nr:hypothetical protein [Candidatus Omnitrophota bacterium]
MVTTGRLSEIDYVPDDSEREIAYTYNQDGLITVAQHKLGAVKKYVRYEYDNLNRLVRESGHKTSPGNCVVLDGVNDYLGVSSGGDLGGELDGITVEARIYMDEYPSGTATIFKRGTGSGNLAHLKVNSNGNLLFEISTDEVDDEADFSGQLPLGEWVHIAGTWSESSEEVHVYVNGSERGSGNEDAYGVLESTGSAPQIGSSAFEGKIDEVRVKNVVTTSFNFSSNYSADASTIGLWHFDETSGTNADDAASDDLDGTLTNGATWGSGSTDLGIAEYAYTYTYDDVGNRLTHGIETTVGTPDYDIWRFQYNDLNQLTLRWLNGIIWQLSSENWAYTYDDNGNLSEAQNRNSGGTQLGKWTYTWNPWNHLTKAEWRTGTGTGTYAGKVEYRYSLIDGTLAERIDYNDSVSTTVDSWRRYEYNGLQLLRVDERYDTGGGSIDSGDPWRTVEVNTYGPGLVGNLFGKRAYTHTDNDATPDSTEDYGYGYDHVGNLYMVFAEDSSEAFYFTQDAFGNEISSGNFNGDPWSTARSSGVWEHQTGKWLDPVTGLYFFNLRWVNPEIGRFLSRTAFDPDVEAAYVFCENTPTHRVDNNGFLSEVVHPGRSSRGEDRNDSNGGFTKNDNPYRNRHRGLPEKRIADLQGDVEACHDANRARKGFLALVKGWLYWTTNTGKAVPRPPVSPGTLPGARGKTRRAVDIVHLGCAKYINREERMYAIVDDAMDTCH